MEIQTEMLRKLKTRREGYSLDRAFYVDPGYYRQDLEQIWYRDWLFIGHDCEIPRPGNYFTVQVGEYPVVLVRDRQGAIRALHNSCRHRGSRVCTQHRGSSAKLVCPYHQWTYELDGRLLFARQMPEGFDPAEHSLKAIHCETVGGYIFISLADEPVDFRQFRETVAAYLAPHRLGETKVAFESTIVEKGNWKLVWENNRECYHCAANHPELCRTYPEAPTVTGVQGAMDAPEIGAHWRKCENAGLPSAFRIAPTGQFRMTRMPLINGAESYTMSGQSAVLKPLSPQVNASGIGTLLLFHYPTTWNHILGDHAITFRVLPLGPELTEVTTKWLVNKEAVEGVDYTIEDLTHVWTETNDQDRQIVEENAFGIRSPAYEPGPYSAEHEGGVMQFVEWYSSFMLDRLQGGATHLSRVA
ncbi:aromatic ring-hydroxylating oxygenase subunit alpha [Sinorhizobium medicae]|uniref:aromatic ring-hydroxylating oxygenase subunit alpha n=1 Tax=Sinorhizobium medicae TaxID=110321 RepID=UPI000FDA9488|nr:aromatic ring-hydroxylating dioxygenase subunit alpha [Sinorhizobium medicae]MDX0433645.1 Rieske 2Fe-2S domain-containing protein [Sinorhizobium medicae]MDX0649230.1 Rieske 2Fe-2S domain-containing protein [Sinorhizobium medicae]MDX1085821.1 Rieske 2Fe-2S domain-containing protein [Sinorhizobium medicae]MDX1110507.1 Rieske 2Fe-2S domain-containing protein [Sinorhizobium medicae]MDX1154420.1 Rieske 2Fe-2S domain-containing protein [Sinorhizobium medicae]